MGKFIADLIGGSSKFILGIGGNLIKSISGGIAIRNNADSADAELTTSKVNISGDSLVINSDAAGSGSDRSVTLSRPSSGMSANYQLICPTGLGTTNQALILTDAATGQLGWGSSGSGSGTPESSSNVPNTLALRDGNGDTSFRKITITSSDASTSTSTGALVVNSLGVANRISVNDIVATAGISAANFNGYTPENAANKSATTTLGISDTVYPTQKAVKTYVDNAISTVTINTRTSTPYTLVLTDAAKMVEMNVASANVITVPTNASVAFPVGTMIRLANTGAGTTTVQGAAGVTINSVGGATKLIQHAEAMLTQRATNVWYLSGALSN